MSGREHEAGHMGLRFIMSTHPSRAGVRDLRIVSPRAPADLAAEQAIGPPCQHGVMVR
jgi:hypothetical protein